MTEVSFDELLARCERSATKLEMRDFYLTADPAYLAWQAGEPLDQIAAHYADWTELVRATVVRGVAVRRVRLVSEPVGEYIRFEHAVTPAVNLDAGEEIRWLGRRAARDLVFPSSDVWLIDDARALFLYFSADGELADSELVEHPETIKACVTSFTAAWPRAIEHGAYRV